MEILKVEYCTTPEVPAPVNDAVLYIHGAFTVETVQMPNGGGGTNEFQKLRHGTVKLFFFGSLNTLRLQLIAGKIII